MGRSCRRLRDEVAGLSDYGVVARVSGHAGAHDQMRLLFEGHRCDHIVDRRLSQTGVDGAHAAAAAASSAMVIVFFIVA